MHRASRYTAALALALLVVVWAATVGTAAQLSKSGEKVQGGHQDGIVNTPGEVYYQKGDGAPTATSTDQSIPPGSSHVKLVSKFHLTDIPGRVADVTYLKGFAYLNAWTAGLPTPACTGGFWRVDIRDPHNPRGGQLFDAARNSYYTEGAHALHIDTPFFTGDLLLESVEACGKTAPNTGGGLDIWDITDPMNPVLIERGFGDYAVGDVGTPPDTDRPHSAHSTFGWRDGNQAYAFLVDNEENLDVDLVDITDPYNPVMIAETGIEEWPGAEVNAYGDLPFFHDGVAKKINGTWHLMASYWDAGWVDLNVDNPANPVFIDDSNYAACDPVMGGPVACPPEGNAHQNEWNRLGGRFVGTDEDFSPFRLTHFITSGPNAGEYPAGEFGWTVPIQTLPDKEMNGPTIYGGYGCPDDRSGIMTASEAMDAYDITLGPDEELILAMQRGPVEDPNESGDACFFSEKVETAQLLGYGGAIVGNHHVGSGAGAQPDAFLCGSKGHEFDVTIPGTCIGHRELHLLFDTTPSYDVPYPLSSDPAYTEPDVNALGAGTTFTAEFDGWGYSHLHNANTMAELDQYAIPAATSPGKAIGFGDLTVHEVAMERNRSLEHLAYFAWYNGGFRVARWSTSEIHQVGWYVDPAGNNFWGVELCGYAPNGDRLICGSDRDFGLFVFKYTGNP